MKLNHFYSYFWAIKEIKKQNGKLEKNGWVVQNDLNLSYLGLYFLPVIKKINGSFDCSRNSLNDIENNPFYVNGNVYCYYNNLLNKKRNICKGCLGRIYYQFLHTRFLKA